MVAVSPARSAVCSDFFEALQFSRNLLRPAAAAGRPSRAGPPRPPESYDVGDGNASCRGTPVRRVGDGASMVLLVAWDGVNATAESAKAIAKTILRSIFDLLGLTS
jgi:hypothetical protein